MDPITIFGAIASITQLLDMSRKIATSSRSLVISIVNAPAEIGRLTEKLERLEISIKQLKDISDSTPIIENSNLFPEAHKKSLYDCLVLNANAVKNLRSISHPHNAASSGLDLKARVRWATIDKRKTRAILTEVREAEATLDRALNVLGARLDLLNYTSLVALQTTQEALMPTLIAKIEGIMDRVCDELLSALQNNHNATMARATPMERRRNANYMNRSEMRALDEEQKILEPTRDLREELHQEIFSPSKYLDRRRIPDLPNTLLELDVPMSDAERSITLVQDPISLLANGLAEPDRIGILHTTLEARLSEHTMAETLSQRSWSVRYNNISSAVRQGRLSFGAAADAKSTRCERKARLALYIGLRVISWHLFRFELNLSHSVRKFLPSPSLGCSLTTVNIREANSRIFQACYDWDLEAVQFLLKTGQASVYDVDARTRRGLLEHVLRPYADSNDRYCNLPDTSSRGLPVLQYLLRQGCNPNTFHSDGATLPAVLVAFSYGLTEWVSSMRLHRAEIDSFDVNPSSLITEDYPGRYQWQTRLLRSIEFSDWRVKGSKSLLHAACCVGEPDEILFALEIANIACNEDSGLYPSPLGFLAFGRDHVRIASFLLEHGAFVNAGQGTWNGTPLCQSVEWGNHDLAHLLLFEGADPTLQNIHGINSWYEAWNTMSMFSSWAFIQHECLLTHLLMHQVDPLEPVIGVHNPELCKRRKCNFSNRWWTNAAQIKTAEFARVWSFFGYRFLHKLSFQPRQNVRRIFEQAETDRKPKFTMSWSSTGIISRHKAVTSEQAAEEDAHSSGDISASSDASDTENSQFLEHTSESVDGSNTTTLFFQNISTPEGRNQLESFPSVRLYCNALQLAGFRADMDIEGDVWFEDEDGDMYHDALEYQTDDGGSKSDVSGCPICRDPEKYGLGHILREVEAGRQQLFEYRAKVEEKKKKFYY